MKYINAYVVIYLIAGCIAFIEGLILKKEIVTLLGLIIIGLANVTAAIKHLDKKISQKFMSNNLETINDKTSNK